ncbi:MAG: hypothetical protein QW578_06680, partial [Thermoplasmatales archaeon]
MKMNKIIVVLLIALSLISLPYVTGATYQTVPQWYGDTNGFSQHNGITDVVLPYPNSSVYLNTPLNSWIYIYGLTYIGGNLTIYAYDSYSAINILVIGFGQTVNGENATFNQSSVFAIFVTPNNTTISIDGNVYSTNYTATSLVFAGQGQFTYSSVIQFSNTGYSYSTNVSEVIFAFVFVF